ncbi:NADP-dependent oxidoreductase domain-containing protein [Xylaria acuta]|nr:NADP-dependent oxidoreductase domain-containing protein [Xylaria acuta]
MDSALPQPEIGDDSVSAQGQGCMGMTSAYTSYGSCNEQESLEVLTQATDMGITFWDTSDAYGPFTNEGLLGEWSQQTGQPGEIFLATKFGVAWIEGKMRILGDIAYVKRACGESLAAQADADTKRPPGLSN